MSYKISNFFLTGKSAKQTMLLEQGCQTSFLSNKFKFFFLHVCKLDLDTFFWTLCTLLSSWKFFYDFKIRALKTTLLISQGYVDLVGNFTLLRYKLICLNNQQNI